MIIFSCLQGLWFDLFFAIPGSEIKERLSDPKISSSPMTEAVPSTVMSDFSALGSLCSAYASDSGDDEEPAGTCIIQIWPT